VAYYLITHLVYASSTSVMLVCAAECVEAIVDRLFIYLLIISERYRSNVLIGDYCSQDREQWQCFFILSEYILSSSESKRWSWSIFYRTIFSMAGISMQIVWRMCTWGTCQSIDELSTNMRCYIKNHTMHIESSWMSDKKIYKIICLMDQQGTDRYWH